METLDDVVDGKELEALLHQAETFRPHLERQLGLFCRAKSNVGCGDLRVLDIGCGPCPSIHVILEQLKHHHNRHVQITAIDNNKNWLEYNNKRNFNDHVTFLQCDLSSDVQILQCQQSKQLHDFFELGICLFSVQALNCLFDEMEKHNMDFVAFKFLLIHAFTVATNTEKNQKFAEQFFQKSLSKRIQANYSIYSSIKCPVQLNSDVSKEIVSSVAEKMKSKESTAKNLSDHSLIFVSLLLKRDI